MAYKIIFFDIDGTITHHDNGSISQSTKLAIQSLKRNGIQLVAATGRPLSMCEEIRDLGIDTFITANGGYVTHKDKVLHKIPLDKQLVKEVVEFSQVENHGLSFYTEDFNMNGVKEPEISNALKETLALDEYPAVDPSIHQKEIYLLCLFGDDPTAEKYQKAFPNLTFRRWHPYVLNVLQEDVSKSVAILKVLEHFGYTPSEAIAFGDGENDIDMLELVGVGVAMGNGSEKLKQTADFVTKKSSEDGISFALAHYNLI
ncbi:Cof-type HAD-IIB family hydrolase [Thalassobacillus hwangdonensis]|uniref:Cof-type HAD-IIB family hydrolase n=1 Tax=Thalassobacillus hwangdonensis TaxID=546108 RepID=A0ABW3L4Y0_9BACI